MNSGERYWTGARSSPGRLAHVGIAYIWVQNTQDTLLIQQHEHKNPIKDQPNFIYVKSTMEERRLREISK